LKVVFVLADEKRWLKRRKLWLHKYMLKKTLHIHLSQTETEKEIEKALYFLISKDKVEDDEDKESLNFLYRATFLK
jgi:hypothetical protein